MVYYRSNNLQQERRSRTCEGEGNEPIWGDGEKSAAEENEDFCRGGLKVGREYGIIHGIENSVRFGCT